jgi:hypothetical protein
VRLAYVTAGLNPRKYKSAGLDAELRKHCENIGMLLRDRRRGTTADITDDCVLYWDAGQLNGAHLSAEKPGAVVDPFRLEDVLPDIREAVSHWLIHPRFTFRPSLLEWLQDPSPQGAPQRPTSGGG